MTNRRAPIGRSALLALIAGLSGGCGAADLPGFYYDVTATTREDTCNSPAVQYTEDFEYRLFIEANQAEVGIGPDTFATGTVDGCTVSYASITWTETRDAGNIQWTLEGEATAERGGGACGAPSAWFGTETFTVQSSEDPSISPGCTYTLDLLGSYIGEVE
jgi:hypothetical protein